MMGLSNMFDGFRRENMNQEFADICMEALDNADQRDMIISTEANKNAELKGTPTNIDATGEVVELSDVSTEDFDVLAEEALGVEEMTSIELDQEIYAPEIAKSHGVQLDKPFNADGNLASGGYSDQNKVDLHNDNLMVAKAKQDAGIEGYNFSTEEWEFDADDTDMDHLIDSIPESDAAECCESFRALDDSNDGTKEQQLMREALSAQIDLLLPSY